MSRRELSQYMSYRNNIKRQLFIVGLWPIEDPTLFYRLRPCFFLMLSVSLIFGIFGYVKIHLTNIGLVTKGLSIMVSYLAVTLKMTLVIMNREDANQLHNILDLHFSKLLNNSMSKLIFQGVTMFQRLSWVLTFVVALCSINYVAVPLIFIMYQYFHQVHPIKYILSYPAVYPWTVTPGFRYEIHFILESIATVSLICVTTGVDSLFTMYGFQMIGQFREMSYRMTHMSNEVDGKEVIRECVLQHQKMMKCRDILQKIYGPVILWIMTTNAVILCSIIFQLMQTKNIVRVIFFFMYIVVKVVQTFMYAWTGTSLIAASDNYREAVYASNWQTKKHIMTSILIILTQRPLVLTACNFSNVTLDLFIMVLNTSMSYFFLLRAIDNDPH